MREGLKNKTLNLLKKHNLRLKKDLSQNFLIGEEVKDRIIKALELKESDTIFEIGGGIGLLSAEIAPKVKRLIVCEIDPNFIPILKENLKGFENAEIIEKDILKIDLSNILKEKAKVFGSVPYHITTPIIFHLLKFREYIKSCLFILQYEVSKRLVESSRKNYGMLSLILQIYTKPEMIMKISPTSFIPKPKPYSSLIRLNFLEEPLINPSPCFFKIAEILFSQRRKKIINSLSKLKIKRETLENLGIDPNVRVEQLNIPEIERIAKFFGNYNPWIEA